MAPSRWGSGFNAVVSGTCYSDQNAHYFNHSHYILPRSFNSSHTITSFEHLIAVCQRAGLRSKLSHPAKKLQTQLSVLFRQRPTPPNRKASAHHKFRCCADYHLLLVRHSPVEVPCSSWLLLGMKANISCSASNVWISKENSSKIETIQLLFASHSRPRT